MSKDRGMFRIYRCARCNNIGYSQVESEEETSNCSLCQTLVLHEKGMTYAVTRQEAMATVREFALEGQLARASEKSNASRGVGVKRRVFNIVESLIDLRRGKPASIEEVMRECSEAGIDLGRAMKFLDTLENEGLISNDGISISIQRRYE
ncbi:hypothetical protein EU528_10425 [Candidatus Thorarchaeota archaeon]|nr:MAG: hypothetical protein EU528_10425 [Candidatus Thorarchaeota archaeon]